MKLPLLIFRAPLLVLFATALGLQSAAAAACSLAIGNSQPTLVFRTEYLPYEYSGFFPYNIASVDPMLKYRTETWRGSNGEHAGAGNGSSHRVIGVVNTGTWTFSKADFSDTSTKEIRGTSLTYGAAPFVQSAMKIGIDEVGFGGGYYQSFWGPVASLETLNMTQRQIVWTASGPLNSHSGWVNADLHEELGNLFTREDAIARGEDARFKIVKIDATDRLQYWNDYSPKTPGEIQSRTQPVKFHAQRISFRVNLDVCEGEYVLVADYKIWAQGAPEPAEKNKTFGRFIEVKRNMHVWPEGPAEDDSSWERYPVALKQGEQCKLVAVRLLPPCGAAEAGKAWTELNSVDITISLGRADAERSAGMILLRADTISAETFRPEVLAVVDSSVLDIRRTPAGVIQQVKAPEILVDVSVLSADAYELRLYRSAQIGALDPASGRYAISGSPFKVYTVANANPGVSATTLRFDDSKGSSTLYAYDAVTRTATMAQLGGSRVENVIKSANGLIEERLVKNGLGVVVHRQLNTYAESVNGRVLRQRIEGISPSTTSTTYTYVFGRIATAVVSNGLATTYTYNTKGQEIGRISSTGRITEKNYADLPDLDGDGIAEALDTSLERIGLREISRSYELRFSGVQTFGGVSTKRIHFIEALNPGASWDATGNLVTVRREIASGPFAGKMAAQQTPDGVLSITSYSQSAGALTTTSEVGAPDVGKTAVIDGIRTTTRTAASGYPVFRSSVDIVSGVTLELETTTHTDDYGRPTRIDYNDGTYLLRTYACCGLASEISRDGAVTTHSYDTIGRRLSTSVNGITTLFTYDAAGRLLATTRRGSDGSEITVEINAFDASDFRTSTRDALGRVTSFSRAPSGSGGEVLTTTFPDGGTRLELSVAGSLRAVVGTATQLTESAEGVDAVGFFTVEKRRVYPYDPAEDYENVPATTEVTTHYVDLAGRPILDLFADGARSESYYNPLGQLSRTVDPDGVQVLYAYNAKGEQTTVAIDLNGNGVIDYAGGDRITRTTSSIGARPSAGGPITVRRTVSEVWDTPDADTPTVVSTAETSLDGRQTWQTAFGLTTSSRTVLDGAGGRTDTTTLPDQSTQIRTSVAGRLTSTTFKDSAGASLSTTGQAYDAHGRLQSQTTVGVGTTNYTYFNDDLVRTVTSPDPDPARTGPGYDPQTVTYAYDTAGRVSTVTQLDGTTVNTTYYPTGAVKRTWGSRTYPVHYTYDGQGRVMTLTTWRDFAGDTGKAVTTWNYDRFRGWLMTKKDATNTGPTYAYWPSGRLKQRTWARQAAGQPLTTAYSYNAAGDLVLTDYSDATPDVSLSCDRLGRSVTTTDASGIRTFGYHLAGAVQSETYGNSGPLAGQSVSRTFDGFYRLGSLSSTGLPASVAYAYDSVSRLREISQASHAATYAYTPNTGDIASITLSANGVTRLTSTKNYDQRGRLASVNHTIGSTALGHSYGYNSADQRTRATREDGSYWDYAYDTLGQINNAVKRRSDGVARLGQTFAYTYDDIGNRRSATLNNQTATYTADVLNRYVTRTVPSVVPVLGRAAADATVLVNRELTTRQDGWFYTEVAAANTTAPQYVKLDVSGIKPPAGAGPEIAAFEQRSAFLAQTPETFAYDSDGNLTQDGRWTYAWDAENRLIAMEARSEVATLSPALLLRLEFAYDGSGRRIRKQVKTRNDSTWTTTTDRRFLYDGWNLIAEFDANATNSTLALVRSYTWGLDLSGSMQGAGGVGGLLWTTFASPATTHAFLADGNGNVIASVDAATGLVSHADDYSPIGETIPLSGSRPGAFGFSSKYTDVETGLLYYGFRYYNPSTGRWLSRDPIEEAGGVNLYGFVSNNPTNDVDPLGLVGGGSGNQPPTPKEIEGARTRAFQLIKYFGNVGEGLPQKLLRRWLWKEGDYKLSDAEFNSVWGEKNYRVNAAFDNASVYKKINTLSMSEDFMRDLASKSEGQTFSGTYLIPDYAFGRTLGHFFWFVKVEAKRGCDKFTYEAKGTVHIEDNYDFNSMDRANRNDEGDVQKMRWFHNITGMGKDFKISSTRYPVSEKAPNSSSPYEAGYLKRQ